MKEWVREDFSIHLMEPIELDINSLVTELNKPTPEYLEKNHIVEYAKL